MKLQLQASTKFNPLETSPEYSDMHPRWQRCRDCFIGEPAIKSRQGTSTLNYPGTAYLPALDGQSADEYGSYLLRATWFNAFDRTVQGLQGMLFRKDMITTGLDAIEDDLFDVTMDGVTFNQFAQSLASEILTVGRAGILVDYPDSGAMLDGATIDDVEREGLRPFWRIYKAESILYHKTAWVRNATRLVEVRLEEIGEDGEQQVRILKLVGLEEGANGVSVETGSTDISGSSQYQYYKTEVWKRDNQGNQATATQSKFGTSTQNQEWILASETWPRMAGELMDFIPFCFVNANSVTPAIEKPPLDSLATVNLSHYRKSADYEHGLHYTALPTPWAAGFHVDENNQLKIGSAYAWVTDNPQASCGFLEFTGAGLTQIREAMSADESKMAALGSRVLTPEKRTVESGEAAAIHRSGEHGILAGIAMNLSLALEKVVGWHLQWKQLEVGDYTVEVNRDFLPTEMPYGAIYALISAVQKGLIGHVDAIKVLQRGEYIDPERTVEDIQAEFETDPIRQITLYESGLAGGGADGGMGGGEQQGF